MSDHGRYVEIRIALGKDVVDKWFTVTDTPQLGDIVELHEGHRMVVSNRIWLNAKTLVLHCDSLS